MDEHPKIDRDEDAASAQRRGVRRMSVEDRFRQNDSISTFRVEALKARTEREFEIAAEYRRAYSEPSQEDWIGETGLRLGAAMFADLESDV